MNQIIKRVTLRYSAGSCFVVAALLYLASCQTETNVAPVSQTKQDSTQVRVMDDVDPNAPPKKPSGPGCCQ